MSARCSIRRAGTALLAALAVSCGGASDVDARNDPAAGTATLPTSEPTDPPGPGDDGLRPGGAPPGAGRPGSPGQAGNGGGHRPGGAPPGVEHDIPTTDDDYSNEDTWLSEIAEACGAVGQPANCLQLEYRVFAQDPGEDGREPVPDPGPNYFDPEPPLYDDCDVTSVHPPSKPAIIIPAGTRIRVEILCQRRDPDSESTETETESEEPSAGPADGT